MATTNSITKYEGELRKAIQDRIFPMRGTEVILDFHLAQFYGVETKALNRAIRRNFKRFPNDFMFALNKSEEEFVKSKFLTTTWGGSRHGFYAFTYKGIAMMSGVLTSTKAIQIHLLIVRTFDTVRQMLKEDKDFARKLLSIESHLASQDEKIYAIYEEVQGLLEAKSKPNPRFGFVQEPQAKYKVTKKKQTK